MITFSEHFKLKLSQHQLDFVDISPDRDTHVYVDPYAIEVRNDIWSARASDYIRTFFLEILEALRAGDDSRALNLMSNLHEPKETFLGVSKGKPKGRGVGLKQASQLLKSIKTSNAYATGLLSDLSEMALYIENFDRDKMSDLTTNIIRGLLVEYTQQQCDLYEIPISQYSGPPLWDNTRRNWAAQYVDLPFINDEAILLVPKYIVRKRLSLDPQEFYNKQITDFLVAEHLNANSSLVQTLKGGAKKVYKGDVRDKYPKSKSYIAEMVRDHPELLELYKSIAARTSSLTKFNDEDGPSINLVCRMLVDEIKDIPVGKKGAERYHRTITGALTALFYPSLIQPKKEWEIHGGRKRIDLVYTNAADTGFFAHRREGAQTQANTVIVECKNYSDDIVNPELDQLLGRFDSNRGKFGILTCRGVDNWPLLNKRCIDMASRSQGYIVVLTDEDIIEMLEAKSNFDDARVEALLHKKFRVLLE